MLERCGGRCEQIVSPAMEFYGPELRCRADADDAHHVIRRSVKRDDRLENLKALCRYHHDLLDSRKTRFGEKAAGRP